MEGFYEKQKTYLRKINNSFINFKKEGATKMNRGSYNAEEVYLQRKGEFEEFLINLVSASSKSERNGENKTSHSEGDHLVRLPVPELPKFSGDFRNWETFRDLLKSMIIDRKDISQVAKLQYLLSCLSGEAADLVRTIPITEENFTLAWQSLQNYYENNRRITSAHLAALFDLKSMQNESVSELRRIYAGTVNPLLSLEALRRPVCHWDDLIVFITERRLDPQTRRDWEIKLENSTAPPTYEMLKNFLKTKIMSLDSLESCGNKQSSGSPKGMQQRRQFHEKSGSYKSKSFHMGGSTVMKNPLCALCGRNHWLAYCETFRDKSVEQRKEFVLSKNLCFNCFGQHVLRNCISKKSCQVCHKKHHTFLHEPSTNSESSKNCVKNQSTSSFPVFTEESIERKLTNVIDSKPETVLLSTAWVKVQGPHGNVVLARALLDQCAQSSFITESLCQRLRLDKKSASVVVSGLGNSHHMKCKGSVSVIIKPRFMSTFSCHTEALVVPKVTLYKPSLLTRDNWPHLKELELADPKYYQAEQIDLLLGAAVHARVVEGRVVKGEANHPIAMATALGWILSGETNAVLPHTSAVFTIQQDDHEIHTALAKQKDVIKLCMVGGFSLRKWHSNSSTLLQWLPQELLANEPESLFANESIFAVLGLNWQPSEDCFNFNAKIDQKVEQWTKRLVLSKVAKLFDPLGWIAPVIIWPKTVFNRRTNEQSKIPIVLSTNNATIKASGFNIFQKYTNLKTTVHVMAYVIRFLQAKKLVHPIFSASWFNVELMNADVILNPSEVIRARLLLVYIAQRQSFSKEISILEKNEIIPKNSVLIRLTPFIDQKLLKVGGRLKHSLLSEDEKHPLIIPSDHPLTRLIIEDCHKRTLHGGVQLTLTTLRTQYWVLKGLQKIKEIIHKCVVCQRYRKSTSYQIMGNLPQYRTMPNRPFSKSGVDYAGPVSIKTSPGKCRSSYKGFICVFVCLSTRAVHLEAVSNYTSEAFIAAFRRFVGRRGHCSLLLSDKGTNFVGADRELKELFQRSSNFTRTLAEALASNGTEWRFNPPTAPHFGGIWEAAVKSTKHHLRRVIGETKLTFEELSTLLCQVEACLNSRPLVPLSDDPNDIQALTPAHFLIQSSSYLIPEPALIEENIPTLKRWQMVQQMLQHYWRRWSREYLQSLQQRQKWATSTPNIKAGDLVIACNDNTPPARWQLARVIKVHPGDDGYVRVVTIQTANSVLKRPVNNLIILK
ncbi:uncharacterized protein LOC124157853 isoform X1 [Ischnura elegans]|uniref:uncharacterized protein LOC124157853 isoform X1 n=1 Tax=Ischnura elegans TaxID=197161 RepID=UPI001ED892DD|nr:uncharacterized protein LOC124157853 isoform X1 [Ischnura elegans]